MATYDPTAILDRGEYDLAWDGYRQLDRAFYGGWRLMFCCFAPPMMLLVLADSMHPLPEWLKTIILIPLGLAFIVISIRVQIAQRRIWRFPCPRCGKRFYGHFLSSMTPGRKCPYCGLFVYQARD